MLMLIAKYEGYFDNECLYPFIYMFLFPSPSLFDFVINARGEYCLAKPYRDILRYGDSVLRYVLNTYWIASKGIEMDF